MKTYRTVTIAILATLITAGADESDERMPEIVANAETKVEVLMDYIKSNGECFPDPDTKVRFIEGRVIMADFKLYENRKPRISEGLVAFELGGKWGACDKSGKVILPARFDSGFEFHEGLAGVNKGEKHGFIDKDGEWVIEPRFDTDYPWDFIGEVGAVSVDGKGAVIDKKGRYVWKPELIRSENLGGGIFIQTADGREGFLDDAGKLLPNRKPNRRYYKGK